MKLDLIKFLKFSKNKNIKKEDKNYVKNKNIYLIIFSAILTAAVGFIIMFFNVFEYDSNFKYKSTIDIPYNQDLDDDNLMEIQKISSEIFNTTCAVQTSLPFPEIGRIIDVKKITITCLSKISKQNPSDQKKIDLLINSLTKKFPKQISVKNKEEVLTTNVKTADIEDFNLVPFVVAFGGALAFVLLYFIFTFRKINGFLVSLSFLVGLIFNVSVITALFLGVLMIFNMELNGVVALPLVAILAAVILNYVTNSNALFLEIKKDMKNSSNENPLSNTINIAINKQMKFLIYNFLLFIIIPGIALIPLNITSISFLAFVLVGVFSGVFCFLFSNFILTQIFLTFKKKKKVKLT